KRVYAKKKVILCAGALNSTKIMLLSGIGDKAVLESLGINVVVDNPNVGANIQNHYGASAVVTNNNASPIPGGQFELFSDARPYMPADGVRRLQSIFLDGGNNTVLLLGYIIQPKSLGTVDIVSKDPLMTLRLDVNMYRDGPGGTPGFNIQGTDAYLIVSFFKIVKAIADAAGETVLYPTPADYAGGDAGLFAAALNLNSFQIASHCAGSSRVGTSKSNGVVDGNLHVFGVKNLMVADISVL